MGLREVKVTELVKSRMGPIFLDCCPAGCTFFWVSISQPHFFFSETEEYSEKEWAKLDLIPRTPLRGCVVLTNHLNSVSLNFLICQMKIILVSPTVKSYPEVQMRAEKIFYRVLYNAIGIAIFIIDNIIIIPFPGGR